MHILTISLNAWNDTQATGNTFSNFFEKREKDMIFHNIYCRNEPFNNKICSSYYRVTESDILASLKNRATVCGSTIMNESNKPLVSERKSSNSNLKDLILHKIRPSVLLFFREFLWMTNKWKTIELDDYLEHVSPDVIYMHGHNNRFMHNLLWYCQEKTKAKVIVFWGDDMYGIKSYRLGQVLYHLWLRRKLKYTIKNADLLLGGSENLCTEYERLFKRKFYPQYKICNTVCPPNIIYENKTEYSMVYAGNLLYGRKELLIQFSKVLNQINQNNVIKLRLFIYSASPLNKKDLVHLDDKCNCFFCGAKTFQEICDILNNCDISLFLESFKTQNIRQTRLSFSTKIIDYMQSSSALLAYGPSEIASIQYLKKTGSAFVVHNDVDLYKLLLQIQLNPKMLNEYALKKYFFALNNHSASTLIPRIKELSNTNI